MTRFYDRPPRKEAWRVSSGETRFGDSSSSEEARIGNGKGSALATSPATPTAARPAQDRSGAQPADRPSVRAGGLLLGIGFGGFFDGILLHQILQWHHMLTSTGDHPATTVVGLETNTLADGLFHTLTLVASLVGLYLIWAAVRKGAKLAGRHLVGLMLAGWGFFNLVEGVVDHQILTVHHVNYDNVVLWDTLFLIFGAVLLMSGWALARSGERAEEHGDPVG
jgi:uncharacterized membrane protein